MSTIWQHTIHTIATTAVVPSALALLDAIMPKDGGGSRSVPFGRPLSATGTGSPTHYLISFQCTETQRLAFDSNNLDSTPGVTYWRCGNPSEILVTTNHAGSLADVGTVFEWPAALGKMSLQIITPTIDT